MNLRSPITDPIADFRPYVVDSRVGIIRVLEEVQREAGAPALFYFYAKACNTLAFCQHQNASDAGGASTHRQSAMNKAIGEGIERYCSAIFSYEDLPLSSFKSARFPCVHPDEFVLYSKAQYTQRAFPFVSFEEHTLVAWAECKDLKTGEPTYIPASMIFLPYNCQRLSGEQSIVQTISTGLACHVSYEDAAISAICEVIERDAFTITWQAKLSPSQIPVKSLSPSNQSLVKQIHQPWRNVTLFNIMMDVGVPTILVAIRSTLPESPAIILAAASHLDPEKAVQKSLEEAAYTWVHAQRLKMNMAPVDKEDQYANVTDQNTHLRFYGEQENRPLADFIFDSDRKIDFKEIPHVAMGNPKQDLEVLIEKIHSVNHRVFVADLTTSDVAPLGLRVIRAVIPGFHPLFMGHQLRALGGTRLWSVPQKLGYKGISRKTGDNPAPHPYP